MTPVFVRLALMTAAAFIGAAPAAARLCKIPRALLCDGCAESLTITLRANGSCVISFTPPTARAAAVPSEHLTVRVFARPPASLYARRTFARVRPRAVALVPAPGGRCFTFNERRYCE
jgi:hypothetical protein